LLKKRVSTVHPYAKKQIDTAIETLVQRSDAFQAVTVVRPVFVMCESLEEIADNPDTAALLDTVLEFIETSFAMFMQTRYSVFDEVARLFLPSNPNGTLSCVVVTLARQWRYARDHEEDSKKFTQITEWFCEFLLRLAIIGENATAITALVEQLNFPASNAEGNTPRLADNILKLRHDIQSWTKISQDIDLEDPFPGSGYDLHGVSRLTCRMWSTFSDQSLAKIFTHVSTDDLIIHDSEVMSRVQSDLDRLTTYETLVVCRRLMIRPFRNDHNFGEHDTYCTKLSCSLLMLQRDHNREGFQQSKLAIAQAYSWLFESLTTTTIVNARLLGCSSTRCIADRRFCRELGSVLRHGRY
jgi:hypothetical protein